MFNSNFLSKMTKKSFNLRNVVKSAVASLAGIISVVLICGFMMTACGGGDTPKSLAKENYEIYKATKTATSAEQLKELGKKGQKLGERIEKLSKEDQQIMMEEFNRLREEGK